MAEIEYWVIVFPAPPRTRDRSTSSAQSSTWTVAKPTRAIKVKARDPQHAASEAMVEPGGHAIVVVDGRRFDRAAEAPLVEHALSGQPFPQAGEMSRTHHTEENP